MQCVFAFLLNPMPNSLYPERLVVASGDPTSLHYGVYEQNVRGRFPQVSSSNIFMTHVKVTVPGTYVRLYCSFTLNGQGLVKKVVEGLENVTKNSHQNFGTTSTMEDKCLDSLKKLAKREIHHITKSKVQNKKACTDLVLVNLISRSLIGMRIDQSASHMSGHRLLIIIRADSEISMGLVISRDHFFKGQDLDREEALAWYRGHLHVLKRDRKDLPWYSVTMITPRPENGAIIIDFLLRNIKPFMAMSGDFAVLTKTPKTSASEPKVKALKNLNWNALDSQLRAAYCQKDILPLPASYPTGVMGHDLLNILEARRLPLKIQKINEPTKFKYAGGLGVS